jgi:hypothetical protein
MAITPENISDTALNKLWESPMSEDEKMEKLFGHELDAERATAAAMDRLAEIMHKPPQPSTVAELLFHTNKRRKMQFDRIPVGHDVGYRCFDSTKHDSESAFMSGEFGDGLTEDEAYMAWLCNRDEKPLTPKAGYIVESSPFQPPEVRDIVDRSEDDVDFDDGLTDDDAR